MDAPTTPRVGRLARWYIGAFLSVFIVTGFAAIEAYPFTGWRLFSGVRQQVTRGWQATVVAPDGGEQPLPFGRLGVEFRGFTHVLHGFPARSPAERDSICAAWLDALRARGVEAASLRIDRTERDIGARIGKRGAAPVRTPRYRCTDAGSEELHGDA